MKSFRDVEATRRNYHRDGALNSVHRASLMVPEIPGSTTEISLLNHFLLKRGYPEVGCRITALDAHGMRLESRLVTIDEPRVYTLPLTAMCDASACNYLVEFFSARNLYIPFPAVMVNHCGPRHLNMVHAYNRVLNDVFEDDAINAERVREASVDVAWDAELDTFVHFAAGPRPCRGRLEVELAVDANRYRAEVPVDVPRLCGAEISLRDCFPALPAASGGVLKVLQPEQFLFYGRLLCGRRLADGSFSANHSYYDTSATREYWDDARPSTRLYPYFADMRNAVRMYPIMAPGELDITIVAHDVDGTAWPAMPAGSLRSPGAAYLDVCVDELLSSAGIDRSGVRAFAVRATPRSGGTPVRVNHQLVHGTPPLESSINVSLVNANVFSPPGKTGFAWGQVPVGGRLSSWLGLVGNDPDGADCDVELTFHDEGGAIDTRTVRLRGGSAWRLDPEELRAAAGVGAADGVRNVWYTLRSSRADLAAFAVIRHDDGPHFSGEHSF